VVNIDDRMTLTKVFSARRFERNTNVKMSLDPSACFVMPSHGAKK
jgi:hypothetical protein